MKSKYLYSLIVIFFFLACKEESKTQEIDIQKEKKEKELVFNSINKVWNFPERTLTPESQIIASSWNEWRLFTNELYQKPTATINAFKVKTKNLTQKADVLPNTIPTRLNKPQIKSRLSALITKLKALNMFLNVDRIPEKRVITMITDLNLEINAFNDQIEEIVRRSHIPLEDGEATMIQNVGGKVTPTTPLPANQLPVDEIETFEEIK
jgi:hypothetical protein